MINVVFVGLGRSRLYAAQSHEKMNVVPDNEGSLRIGLAISE